MITHHIISSFICLFVIPIIYTFKLEKLDYDDVQTTYDGFKVLRVSPTNNDGLSYLKNLSLNFQEVCWFARIAQRRLLIFFSFVIQGIDFWKGPTILNAPVDMMIPPDKLSLVEKKLLEFRMAPEVMIEDVELCVISKLFGNSIYYSALHLF